MGILLNVPVRDESVSFCEVRASASDGSDDALSWAEVKPRSARGRRV